MRNKKEASKIKSIEIIEKVMKTEAERLMWRTYRRMRPVGKTD